MLKRQRPATPPPSSLGDLPTYLPNGPIRHSLDPSEPRHKRQRTQPPPLDGALRGWLASESTGTRWESDGEEDWIEDLQTPLPSTTPSQYKDANSLLHELHVLNQHRLLFVHPPRDRHLDPSSSIPQPTAHFPIGHRQAAWTDGSLPYNPAIPQLPRDGHTTRGCCVESVEKKGLVEEVQYVRQRYEGANRLLGSLFLSRRREVEGMTSSAELG